MERRFKSFNDNELAVILNGMIMCMSKCDPWVGFFAETVWEEVVEEEIYRGLQPESRRETWIQPQHKRWHGEKKSYIEDLIKKGELGPTEGDIRKCIKEEQDKIEFCKQRIEKFQSVLDGKATYEDIWEEV